MSFDNQQVDVSGVEDRRGGGGFGGLPRGVALGGGGGIVALVITVLVALLNGGSGGGATPQLSLDPGSVVGGTAGETSQQLAQRCNTSGALDRYDDCYLIKVYDETDEVWHAELTKRGVAYTRPTLTFFSGQTSTGCGLANAQVGPFYCPEDQRIYLDLDFLAQLQQQFGATGRYAQAYILAHEFGHHIQTLLGTEQKVRQLQQGASQARLNALSVRLELQADCYAGVWGKLADDAGKVTVTQAQVSEAQNAAAAVGDDRIEAQAGVRVNPESWTHGSAAQRRQWYTTGFTTGDLGACDTFRS